MPNARRDAVLTGIVSGIRFEAPGKSGSLVATVEIENPEGAASQLNAETFFLPPNIELRAAEYSWMGKQVRIALRVEVLP